MAIYLYIKSKVDVKDRTMSQEDDRLHDFLGNPRVGEKFVAKLFTGASLTEYTPTNRMVVFQFKDVSNDVTVAQLFRQLRVKNKMSIGIPLEPHDEDDFESQLCDDHSRVFTEIMGGKFKERKSIQQVRSSKSKKLKDAHGRKLEKQRLQIVEKDKYVWPPPLKKGCYTINVHGYICRCGTGRYGAIIRNYVGMPKVAASGVSEPISLVYHMLEGVKCGLVFAKDYGCREVDVCISSNYIVLLIRKILIPITENLKVCEILKEIDELLSEFQRFHFIDHPTQSNRAAYYLSKFHGQNVLDGSVPASLPAELCTIVYQDASGTRYYDE